MKFWGISPNNTLSLQINTYAQERPWKLSKIYQSPNLNEVPKEKLSKPRPKAYEDYKPPHLTSRFCGVMLGPTTISKMV